MEISWNVQQIIWKNCGKINVYGKIEITHWEKNDKIRRVVLNLFGLFELKIKILDFIWSMFRILFVCQIILDSFCCCCCWRWPFTFQHRNNTDEEKIVRGRRRPTKNRYRNCECDFCGPSLTSSCSDAMRTVVFFTLQTTTNETEGPYAYTGLQNLSEVDCVRFISATRTSG